MRMYLSPLISFYDYYIISIVVGSRSDVENVGKLKKADKHW